MAVIFDSGWVLQEYNPGYQYREKPDDLNLEQRREYNTLVRYRFTNKLPYAPQDGSVSTASTLGSALGPSLTNLFPSPSDREYICKDDQLQAVQIGGDFYKQTQTWVYQTDWEDFDPADLAAGGGA